MVLPAIAEESLEFWIYWIGAICTLGIYTILYRENKVYRFFEHLYIGLAVGFGLAQTVAQVLEPVWWQAMMTERAAVITKFDKAPKIQGVWLDKDEKKEGDGSWRWQPSQTPNLSLTDIPADWGTPNYMKLWMRIDKPVSDGKVTLSLKILNPDTKKPATMSIDVQANFSGWRELLLNLKEFSVTGEPYRPFEKAGKYNVLGDVESVEFVANDALQRANPTIHLDELRHCIGYRWWWAFVGVIGLMFYTILTPRLAWMSRMALSLMMGLGAGYTFKGFVLEVGPQIYKSFKPLFGVDWQVAVNNAIFMAVLLCVMTYFFFSIEHRHPAIREPARLGRWLLMLTFGIVFGNTVMGRFSLFIARLDFLFYEMQYPVALGNWTKLMMISSMAFMMFSVAFLLVQHEQRRQQRRNGS